MNRIMVLQQPSSTSPIDEWILAASPDTEVMIVTGIDSRRLPPDEDSPAVWVTLDDYFGAGSTASIVAAAESFQPSLIASNAEDDVVRAAAVRTLLALPGTPAWLAREFRDKVAMKALFERAQIQAVRWQAIDSLTDLLGAIERFGDVIVKPRASSASRGIIRLQSVEEIRGHAASQPSFLDDVASGRLMAEQYTPGEVFHIDVLLDDRTIRLFSPSRYLHPPHTFAEHDVASVMIDLGSSSYDELRAMTERLVAALPPNSGVTILHFEVYRHPAMGFVAGEVACRLGGGMIKAAVQEAFSADLSREGYLLAAGLVGAKSEISRSACVGFVLWTRSTPPPMEDLPAWTSRYWKKDRDAGTAQDSMDTIGGTLVFAKDEDQLVSRMTQLCDRELV
ncbi:acetyl-CoA carboxylase biotin carboxylase subunit family protein [Paenarthrobacter sp. NPDC056912]|uniref:ATP-grasp domain-containing protein n=1 Tax=Paenarthrobacter sp. NPDC056912 TaxID=3345965 RepID=UPI00366F59C6